ncbi:MAG: gamma-glutamylcyclotransferase [Desulfocapsa sp.]|nr:gamma-glutamylcyclotransferase [Desulfocapsa sp.]
MKYFAYGSNMSLNRIRQRVPSALMLGMFSLEYHELRFHKHGRDNSGKCDAYYTNDSSNTVLGVLYQIDKSGKVILDRAEGVGCGYDEKEVIVSDVKGNIVCSLFDFAERQCIFHDW